MSTRQPTSTSRTLAIAQGAFFLGAGIWPILSRRTFEAVTGPKIDFWLVRTVGSLLAVAGGVMLAAGVRDRVTSDIAALGAGSAGALALIDVVYASRGRISKVYLLDALVELGIAGAWALARKREREPIEDRIEEGQPLIQA